MKECYFTPTKNTTSATICANCGQEKSMHTIGVESQPSCLGAVMRSASELEMRLEELQLDFDECKKWYDSAYKKYEDDRKYWGKGEADPNEYLGASWQLDLIKLQIKTIKWCLGGHLV